MRFLGNADRLILISCKSYYLVNRIKLLPVRHYLELCSTSEGEKSLLSALGTPAISDKELMFLNIISKLPLQFFFTDSRGIISEIKAKKKNHKNI